MKNAPTNKLVLGTKLDLAVLAIAGVLSVGVLGVGIAKAAAPVADAVSEARENRMDRCDRMMARIDKNDKKLSTEQIRDIVAGRLAEKGENTLKVGKAATKGDSVVSVEILTASGSLVTTREISTKTGGPARFEQACNAKVANADDNKKDGMHRGGGKHEHRDGHHVRGGMFGGLAALAPPGARDLNLTTDQVKKLADAALILTGNPRLKVGTVKEKDADTITVDIVTTDNALVLRRDIDRDSGRVRRSA